MSLKQLVLEMTPEARQELKDLIDFVNAKEAELATEIAADEEQKEDEKENPKEESEKSEEDPKEESSDAV